MLNSLVYFLTSISIGTNSMTTYNQIYLVPLELCINLKDILPLKALILLYNSFILTYLSYGVIIWGNCYTKYVNSLLKLQKEGSKTVYRLPIFSSFSKGSPLPPPPPKKKKKKKKKIDIYIMVQGKRETAYMINLCHGDKPQKCKGGGIKKLKIFQTHNKYIHRVNTHLYIM